MSARPLVFARFCLAHDGRGVLINPYAVTAIVEGEQEDMTRVFVESAREPFKVMGRTSAVLGELYETAGPMKVGSGQ